ncbi:MAG TPA: hypothetical protein VLW17_14570 [Thermoanaerobaculaceae bacterium]|nr:hypothetical protein [Thermoanaerobaculaceae bacterium]
MATPTPQAPTPAAPAAPAKKGTSPLVWILAGCGGLVLIAAIVMLVGGYLVAHKAKGFIEAAKKNPAMAAAKFAVAVNPDLEVVSEDDDHGVLTIRNKKTGEQITMNAEDIKQGKLKFKNEKGEEVTLQGSGEPGKEGLTIKSNQGTMTLGNRGGQPLPAWVPSYPGSAAIATMSKDTPEGIYGNFSFQTGDKPADILDFYEKALKGSGFTVERASVSGTAALGNLNAKRDGGKREVNVSVVPVGALTQVSVQYTTTGGVKD